MMAVQAAALQLLCCCTGCREFCVQPAETVLWRFYIAKGEHETCIHPIRGLWSCERPQSYKAPG